MIDEMFVSKIDPNYSVICWKGPGEDVAYAIMVKQTNPDAVNCNPEFVALPANECPEEIVAELRPIAREFLGCKDVHHD